MQHSMLVPTDPTSTPAKPPSRGSEDLAAAFLLAYEGHTRAAYSRDLREWFNWCAEYDLDPLDATRGHVDVFARTLSEVEHRSPATVARRLSTLSSFYRYAEGEDAITRNPVTHVRRPKVGTDTVSTGLDADEMTALIHAAQADSPRSRALVLLLGMNGLRISEVLDADVVDLTTERGHRVLLITRKGGKKATIPMAPRTSEAVDAYVGERVAGPLFVTATGKRWERSEVWRTLRRLARVAVPGKATTIHPHDLRRAFVTLSQMSDVAKNASFDTLRDRLRPGDTCPLCRSVLKATG
jgi:integrase/recombinase XerD